MSARGGTRDGDGVVLTWRHWPALLALADGKSHPAPLLSDKAWLWRDLSEMGYAVKIQWGWYNEGTWFQRPDYWYTITPAGLDLLR